ncbi:uncharacterized protein LOC121253558 [Juglans microcarpa x Juglans regia]|uniref:uncharacterized protein LOC121253558 n=1 Tax=Juglans microcarpa x Juglans regia TaxID=2249226 RepID=UPI001B7EBFAB|nr:uncharacterized protein LOC121253558 [Juglans microcarpa x Juglans regia]
MVETDKGQASTSNNQTEIWSIIWKLNIPNAAKVFIWRAYLESLPTNANIFKRKMVDSPNCPICLREQESINHVLWDFPTAKDELLEEFVMPAKKIWQRRNTYIFQNNFIHLNLVMKQAKHLLTGFQETFTEKSCNEAIMNDIHCSWESPPEGCYKVNWDATVNKECGRVGTWIVIRDYEESLGALQAIRFAIEIGLRKLRVEGDALQVVNSLSHNNSQLRSSGVFIWDAKQALGQIDR